MTHGETEGNTLIVKYQLHTMSLQCENFIFGWTNGIMLCVITLHFAYLNGYFTNVNFKY